MLNIYLLQVPVGVSVGGAVVTAGSGVVLTGPEVTTVVPASHQLVPEIESLTHSK